MPKLSPAEYRELKSFFRFFSDRFFPKTQGLAPNQRPLAVLESMEATAPAKAAQGLRMAINDCLEMSSHWRPERVSSLDAELRREKLVTLSELRRRYSREYVRMVKRGRIKSEVEYYLAKGIVDGDSLSLTETDRELLATMMHQYEKAS